jgi:hypothetical protein
MKPRIVLCVGLLAVLVATLLLASARIAAPQQAVDEENHKIQSQMRLQEVANMRRSLENERKNLEQESLAAIRRRIAMPSETVFIPLQVPSNYHAIIRSLHDSPMDAWKWRSRSDSWTLGKGRCSLRSVGTG